MRRLAIALLLSTSLSCHADTAGHSMPSTVSVTGEGAVSVAPDMATATIGVVTQAANATSALAANNDAMSALFGVLDRFDVAERDRRTSNFNVSPRYERRPNDSQPPRITSYEVSNNLSIRYRKIDRLGDLLDAVVKSGSNRIHGLVFGNADESVRRDEARKLAVADARHRAELYAEAAGLTLGKVLSITEAGAPQPGPMLRTTMMAEAASVPISTGENEIRAVVQVVFELE
jgi:uncharacterized protein YggE